MLPTQHFCTFNKASTVKNKNLINTSLRMAVDMGVRKDETVTINANLGHLSITEVDMQSLLTGMCSR